MRAPSLESGIHGFGSCCFWSLTPDSLLSPITTYNLQWHQISNNSFSFQLLATLLSTVKLHVALDIMTLYVWGALRRRSLDLDAAADGDGNGEILNPHPLLNDSGGSCSMFNIHIHKVLYIYFYYSGNSPTTEQQKTYSNSNSRKSLWSRSLALYQSKTFAVCSQLRFTKIQYPSAPLLLFLFLSVVNEVVGPSPLHTFLLPTY
jgi:hypothetical protein